MATMQKIDVRITVRHPGLKDSIQQLAERDDVSVNKWVTRALLREVKRRLGTTPSTASR